MRVCDLIEALKEFPQDIQVTDTCENRIIYPVYKNDKGIITLESFDDIDLDSFFENFFEESANELLDDGTNVDENDMFLELGRMGVRLSDFKGTEYEDMAIEYTNAHAWED